MRWEWDDSGDNRVADLWRMREELSRSGRVVYAKWYRGRATFFSKEVFTAFLALLGSARLRAQELEGSAREILALLEMDSPLSTKQIKEATGLRGRAMERDYERAMKALWSRLLVVGFGEVDDGAFPSLAVGSTKVLCEDLWNKSMELTRDEAAEKIAQVLPKSSLFLRQLSKIV